MAKQIIHVGLHKTATTYLQENVWPAVKGFQAISRPFTQHNHDFNKLQYADDSLYNEANLQQFFASLQNQNIILSDESLSGKPLTYAYINRTLIAQRLQRLLPNAEVILFIRDQKSIIKSHYSSYVKMPFGIKPLSKFIYKPTINYTFEDYLEKPRQYNMDTLYYNTNDTFLHLDCFKYSFLIDLYQQLFTHCHVVLYEDFLADKALVLNQLRQILKDDFTPTSSEKINKSMTERQIESRRKANSVNFGVENKYWRKTVELGLGLTELMKQEPPNLTKQIESVVGDYFQADNERLKLQLPHLNWHNYPESYR